MTFFLEGDIKSIVKNTNEIIKKFNGKKILITGGGGFLGKYFVEVFKEYNKILSKPVQLIVYDIEFKYKNFKNFCIIRSLPFIRYSFCCWKLY